MIFEWQNRYSVSGTDQGRGETLPCSHIWCFIVSARSSLFSNSIIYLATSVINSGLPFFLLPVLTAYLSPDQYGNLGVFQALYTAFLAVIGMGMLGAIVRARYDDVEIGEYIFGSLVIITTSLVVVLLGIWLYWAYVGFNFRFEWVVYSVVYAFCMIIINIKLSQYQVEGKAIKFGLLQVSNALVNMLLSLFFVIVLYWEEEGRILGMVVSSLFFLVFAICLLIIDGQLKLKIRLDYLKGSLKYGLPLIPHELSTFLTNWLAVIIVSSTLSSFSSGIYLFAFQISMVLGVLCDAFNRAFVPWLFAELKRDGHDSKYKIMKVTHLYFFSMMIISVISFLVLPSLIDYFFSDDYSDAGSIVGILVLGQAFSGLYLMVANYLYYEKNTSSISLVTIISSICGIPLMFLAANHFGILGVACIFLLMRFCMFILAWYFSSRVIDMPWFSFKKTLGGLWI